MGADAIFVFIHVSHELFATKMRYTMGEGFCGQYASVVIRLTIAVIFAKII